MVSAIENLGEITLDSADEIASVRGDYKLLGAVNRPLVGNYDTLNAAIMLSLIHISAPPTPPAFTR